MEWSLVALCHKGETIKFPGKPEGQRQKAKFYVHEKHVEVKENPWPRKYLHQGKICPFGQIGDGFRSHPL